ncbi:MAG: anti-sigma factor domain-containing protein [Peptococcaceae bacterium]|nr:anti-sigma factor domain-containing protein [Peptococcaceae bacterium]
MKCTSEYAVVLEQDGLFMNVKVKEGMTVGQKIFFFDEDLLESASVERMQSNWFGFDVWKKAVSFSVMAASLIFFFLFGNLLGLPMGGNTSYAVVSIDINPSVEMRINPERNVVKVEPLNEDGYKVAGQYLIGLKVEDAVKVVIQNAARENYLSETDTVLLAASVYSPNEELTGGKAQEIIKAISDSDLPDKYLYLFVTSKQGDSQEAKVNNLSLGKYEMMVLADGKLEPEKIKNMKVKELIETEEIKSELTEKNQKMRVWLKQSNIKKQTNNEKLQKNEQQHQKNNDLEKPKKEGPEKSKTENSSKKGNNKEVRQESESVIKRSPDPPQGTQPDKSSEDRDNNNSSQNQRLTPDANGQGDLNIFKGENHNVDQSQNNAGQNGANNTNSNENGENSSNNGNGGNSSGGKSGNNGKK